MRFLSIYRKKYELNWCILSLKMKIADFPLISCNLVHKEHRATSLNKMIYTRRFRPGQFAHAHMYQN